MRTLWSFCWCGLLGGDAKESWLSRVNLLWSTLGLFLDLGSGLRFSVEGVGRFLHGMSEDRAVATLDRDSRSDSGVFSRS